MRHSQPIAEQAQRADSHELVSRGRQAAMSHIAPEFFSIESAVTFLVARCAPRMSASESSNSSS